MAGGLGNDTYVVDNASDLVIEAANGGTDTIETTLNGLFLTSLPGSSGENIENLTFFGSGTFDGRGNGLANVITGGSGNDSLYGLDGNDTLVGNGGNDFLSGGVGSDTVRLSGPASQYRFDATQNGLTVTHLNGGSDGVDSLLGIEFISFAGGPNIALSTLAGVVLYGDNNGALLTGSSLGDYIGAGTGNDTLIGLGGGDELVGGAGVDTVSYAASNAAVALTLNGNTVATGTGGHAEGDKVRQVENIIGSAFNDSLTGDGLDNLLDGGLGNDTLTGGAGNDTYVVNIATDSVVEAGGGGTDTVQTTLAIASLASYANIENLTYIGTAAFTGTGDGAANIITGGVGADILTGGGGNDTLRGGGGTDTAVFSGAATD
jgi:Ca2+-binding RTX toxin-like protein